MERNNVRKFSWTQVLRHIVQLAAFIFFPGVFMSVFNALRDVVTSAISGTFSFAELLPELLIIAVVVGVTALWGRFFCGYLCAFGAMQELTAFISRKLMKNKKPMPRKLDKALKFVKYGVLFAVILLFWVLQLPADSSLNPWGVFGMLISWNFSTMTAAIPTVGFVLLLGILVGSFFIERFFCRYLCPLGAIFTPISKLRLYRIKKKASACTSCGNCSRSCPMGIEVSSGEKVSSGECIDCMRCTKACCAKALTANPAPAIAGTATAVVMCGLVNIGSILPTAEKTVNAAEITTHAPELSETPVETEVTADTETPIVTEAPEETAATTQSGALADGVFTGAGTGYRGTTTVSVTVEGGVITDITVVSYSDNQEYFTRASRSVIPAIIEKQSIDISTVSGATFSSRGILEAVADALSLDYTNTNSSSSHGGHGRH